MNIESIKQFVKEHKIAIIGGATVLTGVTAVIVASKGHTEAAKAITDAAEHNEEAKEIVRAFTRWEGSVDPDAGSGGLDVIIDKTFPDIQSAGGWLMDNWDKVPGWRDGIIQIVKDCGEHQNEIQIFCQLL